jgi:hypothetical protein
MGVIHRCPVDCNDIFENTLSRSLLADPSVVKITSRTIGIGGKGTYGITGKSGRAGTATEDELDMVGINGRHVVMDNAKKIIRDSVEKNDDMIDEAHRRDFFLVHVFTSREWLELQKIAEVATTQRDGNTFAHRRSRGTIISKLQSYKEHKNQSSSVAWVFQKDLLNRTIDHRNALRISANVKSGGQSCVGGTRSVSASSFPDMDIDMEQKVQHVPPVVFPFGTFVGSQGPAPELVRMSSFPIGMIEPTVLTTRSGSEMAHKWLKIIKHIIVDKGNVLSQLGMKPESRAMLHDGFIFTWMNRLADESINEMFGTKVGEEHGNLGRDMSEHYMSSLYLLTGTHALLKMFINRLWSVVAKYKDYEYEAQVHSRSESTNSVHIVALEDLIRIVTLASSSIVEDGTISVTWSHETRIASEMSAWFLQEISDANSALTNEIYCEEEEEDEEEEEEDEEEEEEDEEAGRKLSIGNHIDVINFVQGTSFVNLWRSLTVKFLLLRRSNSAAAVHEGEHLNPRSRHWYHWIDILGGILLETNGYTHAAQFLAGVSSYFESK